MSHGARCSAGAERERASSSGVSAFLKLKNPSGCRAAGVVQEITQQRDVISLLPHWKTCLFFLLFLPNNRHYSCKALLVSTLDFINASHPKGCNAHRLPAAFAPLSHIHWEYELMAAPVWAEASRFISRPSTLLLYSIKFLSLFAFASPLTSGGRSAQRRKRMNKMDLLPLRKVSQFN